MTDATAGGDAAARRFAALWASLAPIGSHGDDGYVRYSWTAADLDCREWFEEEARDRDLDVEHDRNGNIWATWLPPGVDPATPAVATGSHLDSVPHGGAYDGPLGVVSALLAVDELRARGVTPARPIKVAVFTEEEGSRFGLACLGSRLLTGVTDPARALALEDRDGVTLADAMARAGVDPAEVGPDPARVAGLAAFIELHIEQGHLLTDAGRADAERTGGGPAGGPDTPVGIASAIWPHGRWRFDFTGAGNHAGTTRMSDRHDPMLTYAYTVLAANKEARLAGAHATIGRVRATPNATNAVPSAVTGWLDARAADEPTLARLVQSVTAKAGERAGRDGTTVTVTAESVSPETTFDAGLIDRLRGVLAGAPVLPTGAGHDAGVLAAHVPTAMLFVRNPTGVSHAPTESATDADCAAGVAALADVLAELTR